MAIGLGILPGDRRDRVSLAARTVLRSGVPGVLGLPVSRASVALWVYTAAKSTYLLSSLQPAIEERNLFFLSPLLLIGTALVLYARKVSWPLVAVATVVVIATVWSGMFEVGPGYFEAPGLAILTLVNRDFHWDVNAFHRLLGAAALVSVVLLAQRHRRGVGVLAAVLTASMAS